jgi:hypothetical protein
VVALVLLSKCGKGPLGFRISQILVASPALAKAETNAVLPDLGGIATITVSFQGRCAESFSVTVEKTPGSDSRKKFSTFVSVMVTT